MSTKYKVSDSSIPHFVTFSVVGWIDVFSREQYKEIFVQSLQYCIEHKGLSVHAWVIMTNHVHLIISSKAKKLDELVRDIKKFTSKQILIAIAEAPQESRKEWMLNIFSFTGKGNKNNKEFQFWKQDYHPIELTTHEMMQQRLTYLHENPVRAGLVWELGIINTAVQLIILRMKRVCCKLNCCNTYLSSGAIEVSDTIGTELNGSK